MIDTHIESSAHLLSSASKDIVAPVLSVPVPTGSSVLPRARRDSQFGAACIRHVQCHVGL